MKCAQLIVSAGIKAVIFETPYRLPDGVSLLKQAGVIVKRWDPEERVLVVA